jgi:hypothetical protein
VVQEVFLHSEIASFLFGVPGPLITKTAAPNRNYEVKKKITIIEFSEIRLGNLKFVERNQIFHLRYSLTARFSVPSSLIQGGGCTINPRPLSVTPMILQINMCMLNKSRPQYE